MGNHWMAFSQAGPWRVSGGQADDRPGVRSCKWRIGI